MSPDNLTPSDQGRGTDSDKRHNTEAVRTERAAGGADVPQDELPISRREAQRAGQAQAPDTEEIPGNTRPLERHHNRPERDKAGGNYNGPDKR